MLDIFAGEWASRLPPPYDGLRAGQAPLFADERIRWTLERFGPLDGQSVRSPTSPQRRSRAGSRTPTTA